MKVEPIIHPELLYDSPEFKFESDDGVDLHHMQKVYIITGDRNNDSCIKEARFDKAYKALQQKQCEWWATQGFSADYLGYPCWWTGNNGEWDRGRVHPALVYSTREAAEKDLAEYREKYGPKC